MNPDIRERSRILDVLEFHPGWQFKQPVPWSIASVGRERRPAATVIDSMQDHAPNSLSVLRPSGTRPRPFGVRPEPQGPDEVAAAGALLEVSRLFTALLRLTRPDIGLRTERITALVSFVVRGLEVERRWEFEVAARMSQLGWLGIAPEVLQAATRGELLSDDDLRAVASHPLAARDLLCEVSRLDTVAEMIARQHEPVGLAGEPLAPVSEADRLAFGGQLLRVCGEFDRLAQRGLSCEDALSRMGALPEEYDPAIVARLHGWRTEVAADVSCPAA
jgi:hypothetical protein